MLCWQFPAWARHLTESKAETPNIHIPFVALALVLMSLRGSVAAENVADLALPRNYYLLYTVDIHKDHYYTMFYSTLGFNDIA